MVYEDILRYGAADSPYTNVKIKKLNIIFRPIGKLNDLKS